MKKFYSTILAILTIATTAMAQTTYTEVYTTTIAQDVETPGDPIQIEIDATAIETAIGCTLAEATIVSKTADNEYTDAHTSNTAFWYNNHSQICHWNDEGFAFYFEYPGGSVLDFGQIPDNIEVGDVFKPNLGFANGDKVALINFELTMVAAPEAPKLTFENVTTLNVSGNVQGIADYSSSYVEFDLAAVTAALGCEIEEAKVIGVDPADAEAYTDACTANNGFWYTNEGVICNHAGEGCTFFIEYRAENNLAVGFFPDAVLENGQVLRTKFGFAHDEKAVILDLTLTVDVPEIPDYQIVETKPLAANVVNYPNYTATQVPIDVETIQAAIGCAPADATVVAVDPEDPEKLTPYGTGENGFWYTKEGKVCTWGAEGYQYFINYPKSDFFLIGQQPDNLSEIGDTYTTKIGFANGDKVFMYDVTITIVEPAPAPEFEVVFTQNVSINEDLEAYVGYPVEIDVEGICAAIGCALDEAEFVAPNPDGGFYTDYTATFGYWYGNDNEGVESVKGYGDGCTMFIEFHDVDTNDFEADFDNLYVGQYHEGLEAGKSYKATAGFMFEGKVALINVTLNINKGDDDDDNGDDSGVDEVIANGNANNRIYNLQGIEVKAQASDLPAGLYIIGGKKVYVK